MELTSISPPPGGTWPATLGGRGAAAAGRRMLVAVVAIALAALLGSCAAPHYDDPVKVMASRQSDPTWRIAATKQAAVESPNDPKRISALNDIAWDHRGNPDELRILAIDQLIAMDEKDFVEKLERRIVLIP